MAKVGTSELPYRHTVKALEFKALKQSFWYIQQQFYIRYKYWKADFHQVEIRIA